MARDSRPTEMHRGKLSRRKLLKVGGTVTVLGTAGCAGDGGGDDEETEDGGMDETPTETEVSAELVDDTFDAPIGSGTQPSQHQYNPYNPTNNHTGSNAPVQAMQDQLFAYNLRDGTWQNRMATGFDISDGTITVDLREDYTWNDGDPVTADDWVAQFQIVKALEFPVWNILDSVSAPDDYTLELETTGEVNPGIAQRQVNRKLHVKADSELGAFAQDVQDASSDEMEQVVSDITSFSYAMNLDPNPPKSNGPFHITEITEQEIRLERNPDYPIETNVQNVTYFYTSSSEERAGAMISGRTDGQNILAAEQQVREQFPDSARLLSLPGFGGTQLRFNHNDSILGMRAFRHATAYLLSNENITQNSNPRLASIETTCWLTDGVARNWLSDEVYDAVSQYGPEGQPDKATQVLEEAGFTQDGGNWLTPDGETMEYSVKTPPWPAPLGISQTVADRFSQFGIPTSVQQQEGSTWSSDGANGNFTLYGGYYGGGPHPFFSFEGLQGNKETAAGIPLEAEVPPVAEPDGSMQTMNVEEKVTQLNVATDPDEEQQLVEEIAWFINQTLPGYNATQGTSPTWITVDDWTWGSDNPVEDNRLYFNNPSSWGSALRQVREGTDNQALLQGKTQ